MYTQRIIHTPAVGKSQELRAVLLERNASGNADAPHSLSVNMFSPQAGYVHAIRFENLAALEAYQERPSLRESAFQEQGRRIDQCLAQVRAALDAGRYVEVRGDSGVGKSSLLKHLAREVATESRIVVLSPGRTTPRGCPS